MQDTAKSWIYLYAVQPACSQPQWKGFCFAVATSQQQEFYSLVETKTHTRIVTKGETKCPLRACSELRDFTPKPFSQVLEVCL